MSREIKFDAIYKPTGEHFNPIEINFNENIITGNFDGKMNDWCHFSLDGNRGDAILREYTGLKDKNGKEIYEGDIVRKLEVGFAEKKDIDDFDSWLEHNNVVSHEIEEDGYVTYRYTSALDVVVMDRFPCYWLKKESFGYEGEDLVSPSDCEVIGNIYENPELLEAQA